MNRRPPRKKTGLTLIEMTLVLSVLLSLVSVLFLGASAYKEGSHRSTCLLNIYTVQNAVRAYQNMYQKMVGDPVTESQIVGPGRFLEAAPACRSGGTYTFLGTAPPLNTPYLTCSLAASKAHFPTQTNGW